MKNFKDKVIVITGAGSGIGRALSILLAEQQAILALNDWNKDTLEETVQLVVQKGGIVISRPFDVRERNEHVDFATAVFEQYGKIDGIINNAGVGLFSASIQDTDPVDFKRVIDVNLWGVIHGTQAFLPYLLKQQEAFVTNICSVLGLVGLMGQGAYVTAKSGVKGFTETLFQELKNTNVDVIGIYPGAVDTNIVRNVKYKDAKVLEEKAKGFKKMAAISAEGSASEILKAIQKNKQRVVLTRPAKIMDFFARYFPRTYHKMIPDSFHPDRHQSKKKRLKDAKFVKQ